MFGKSNTAEHAVPEALYTDMRTDANYNLLKLLMTRKVFQSRLHRFIRSLAALARSCQRRGFVPLNKVFDCEQYAFGFLLHIGRQFFRLPLANFSFRIKC
jgi:hypothetical protein